MFPNNILINKKEEDENVKNSIFVILGGLWSKTKK
jgi:hypothetical protein